MRFMYLAYGVQPYSGNGRDVVNNYSGSRLQKIQNGTAGKAPQPGDILSYYYFDPYGHTSVVVSSSVDGNGNGTIQVLQQNWDSPSPYSTLNVQNWTVNHSYVIMGWLHDPSSDNQPPYKPSLITPADSSASSSTSVTLSWKDNGDPDPNDTYRNYDGEVYLNGTKVADIGLTTGTSWTLNNLSPGAYEWRMRAGDGKAPSGWAGPWRFTVDTVAPTGSFTLNYGWATANSISVPLDLTATDQHSGVQDVRVGSTCSTLGAWQPFQPRIWWQFAGQHGDTVRVCAQFRDRAGNMSLTTEQSTRLDFYPAQLASVSYRLRSDVSAISGEPHQSSSYRLNSTAGQTLASGSYATSSGYRTALGFWPRFFFTPPTYTIAGTVTSGGVGLAGVTITDGTRNAATDSSGNYTLSGVPSGSYTLTPSLNGYSFSPASLSVSVSGNVTGQNFTGTPTAIATPLPTAMPSPTATPLPPTATPSPTATATPPTGTAVLALMPTTTAFAVGDTFIVGVEVQSGAQSVDGAAVYLDFDPAVLEVLSVIPSSSLPITLTQQLDPIGGHLDLVRGAISPLPQGTFALATITFRARSAAPGGTLLGLSRTAARQSDVTFNGSSVLGQTVPVTITVNDGLALTVEIQFQGLPLAPSPRLSVPLSVTLTLVGATTPVYQSTLATDQYGRFSITGVAPGTYTLSVKHAQSLRVQTTAVVSAGATTLSVGPLPSGDSNDDNRINVLDFSLLASTFGKSSSTTGYDGRADFNSDGIINLLDFSLLATNFGKAGLASATPALTTASSSQVIAQVVRDLTVGETFTLDLAVNAPTTGIDGAAAYLNFDPTLLDVVNIAVDPTLDLTLQQEVNTTSGQVALVRGTLRGTLPTGRVKLATITFRARMQAAAAAITLVDDGALRQSAVTASGRVLTLAEAPWQLTAGSAGHSVYLPLVVR